MAGSIEKRRTYQHPLERVWRAVTDPEILSVWLMPTDFEPTVGHRFAFRTDPSPGFDGVVHGEVLRVEPPRLLEIAWRGNGLDTTVRFELQPVDGGTELRLVHAGFEGVSGAAIRLILSAGWSRLLRISLARVLDGGRPPAKTPARGLWSWLAAWIGPWLPKS